MANIIITESQLRLISERLNIEMILEEASNNNDRNKILSIVKKLLAAGISAAVIVSMLTNAHISDSIKKEAEAIIMAQPDTMFFKKVDAVKDYMATAAKNQGYNPSDIKLSPEAVVQAANDHDFDLPFLLAQAHLESCFGLTPRARRTNSVFSVGCYDNGKNVCNYPSQDDSIVPYINLIKNDYLVGGKTLDDLLQKGKFVNGINKRYASDPYYESKVKNIRNRIISKYPELL